MGDILHLYMWVLSKPARLRKVSASLEILLLHAKHSAPGSLEDCHGMIAMTKYSELEGLMVNVKVLLTPPGLLGERVVNHPVVLSVCNGRLDIAASTCPPLVVRYICCLQLGIVRVECRDVYFYSYTTLQVAGKTLDDLSYKLPQLGTFVKLNASVSVCVCSNRRQTTAC